MAQLVFGLIGSSIGSAIGGSFLGFSAAQIGFNIGSLIGGFLFGPQQEDTFGPRLSDLKVTASVYGLTIPIAYGTFRMSGNVIWAEPIKEVATEKSIGKGMLAGIFGGGATHTTYEYFGTWAIAFAYREAQDVIRMWADGKKILDRRTSKKSAHPSLSYVFLPGSETQSAVGVIKKKQGAANTTAHRGLCHIVIKNLNLKDWGNRLPQITAEIAFASSVANTKSVSSELVDQLSSNYDEDHIMVDSIRKRIYTIASTGLAGYNVYTYNQNIITHIREEDRAGKLWSTPSTDGMLMKDANLLVSSAGPKNSRPISFIDAETFEQVGLFGESADDANWNNNGTGHAAAINRGIELIAIDELGRGKFHWWLATDSNNNLGILIINDSGPFRNPPESTEFTMLFFENGQPFGSVRGMVGAPARVGQAEAWVVSNGNGDNDFDIYKITIDTAARLDTLIGVTGLSIGVHRVLTAAECWGVHGTGSGAPLGPVYDTVDNTLIIWMGITGDKTVIFKYDPDPAVDSIVWSTLVDNGKPSGGWETSMNQSDVSSGTLGWTDASNQVSMINTADGTIIINDDDSDTYSGTAFDQIGGAFWDGPSSSIITGTIADNIGRIHLDLQVGLGEDLAIVATDLCLRSGYDIADLDVGALVGQTVRGYAITRQMSARTAFGPLGTVFFFDATENGKVIQFVKLGGDPVETILSTNLIRGETGVTVSERRVEEVELPELLTIIYADFERAYQEGAVSFKRVREPTPLVFTRVSRTFEFPIALTATEAVNAIERVLFAAWGERIAYNYKGPIDLLKYNPTDIVTLQLPSGATFDVRLNKAAIGADFVLSFEGVGTEKALFTAVSVSDGGGGFEEDIPQFTKFTRLILLDIPLLRDVDATGGALTRSYFVMSAFEDGWPGGILFVSPDGGTTYIPVERHPEATVIGTVINRLPKTDTPFMRDSNTELEVVLSVGGPLTTITESEFLNNTLTNAALVGNFGRNNWELIFFQTATQQTEEKRFILKDIIRGRRGTDIHVNSHKIGETFIFLTRDTVSAFLNEIAEIDMTNFYKGVGDLQILEEAEVVLFTGTGADLKPYAPVHPDATVDGSSNIDFTWIRRTRLGGEIGSTVADKPLSETTEAYEVDVLNKPGYLGGVVVTNGDLTGLVTPAAEMLNADVTAQLGLRATGVLTLTGQPLNNETVTIQWSTQDVKVYKFVTALAAENDVLIGDDAEDSLENLLAIMDHSQFSDTKLNGIHYSSITLLDTVIATREFGTVINLQAALGGTDGDNITTTETLTNGSFGAGNLAGGAASVPLEVDFVVYQLSGALAAPGRGFGREARIIF